MIGQDELEPASIPVEWDEVGPAWMTEALADAHPGAEVGEVTVLLRDDGSNRRARFGLTYPAGVAGPRRLFVKGASAAHRETYARLGHLFNESELFASGAPLPLEHPSVFRVVIDRPNLDYVIVMEDIVERGAQPRDATRPMSIDQVASGIEGLARLHSHYWNLSPDTHPALAFAPTWEPHEGFQIGLRKHVPKGLARADDRLPGPVAALDGDAIVDLWTRHIRSLTHGPLTLLHGDAHIGNTYVLPDDTVGFLDWEMVRRGNWSQDTAYFMVGGLVDADRRAAERDLVERYVAALDLPAHDRPTVDEAWLRCRAAPIYGLTIWLSTLGTDGWQRPEISLALVDRYARAFVDHDTPTALTDLGV